ncbi:TIGR03032 family protein [Pseudooceanicola batsensis]|nr:TIGR03032 family protein [Pseudooceanicola batsensis]
MTEQDPAHAPDAPDAAQPEKTGTFNLQPSRTFTPWLRSVGGSIAFTTYQVGKLFLIGINPETGRLSVYERSFPRCMGFGVSQTGGRTTLWMSSLYQLWRMENFLDPGQVSSDGFDAVFVPVEGRTTGDIDIHDIHPQPDSPAPVFVATRFNCLATLDYRNSFKPVWLPPFVDRVAAEDRCHLNGLAMAEGKPKYVTCVATTNSGGAWRNNRQDGGVIVDVETNEIVCSGLSMPHSPRLYRGALYAVQSGTGEFGKVDLETGRFEPMCFLPGFVRGVAFVGDHAVIGVSRPRPEKTFEGLALDQRLEEAGQQPTSMVAIVNIHTGDIEHTLQIQGVVQELYDVAFLPGIRRPKLLGFRTPEIRFQVRPAPFPVAAGPGG